MRHSQVEPGNEKSLNFWSAFHSRLIVAIADTFAPSLLRRDAHDLSSSGCVLLAAALCYRCFWSGDRFSGVQA